MKRQKTYQEAISSQAEEEDNKKLCFLCGERKNLKNQYGVDVCSYCQIIRIQAKNRPDTLIKALQEFKQLPEGDTSGESTDLQNEIAQLTAKGCIDAKEHWKDGKYLCLLFKMRKDVRRKTYIGNHPLRVSEARQKLQNYKDRLNCIEIQKRIQSDLDEIELVIQQLLTICAKFDMAALFALQGDQSGDKILSLMRGSSQGLYPNSSHSLSSETT